MIRKLLSFLTNMHLVLSQTCIIDQGFSWCETSNKCVNPNLEPCLRITKDCVLCLIQEGLQSCGTGCSVDMITNIQNEGFMGTDENGCADNDHSTWCPSLNRCINPFIEDCRDLQPEKHDDLCHSISCSMYCPYGFKQDHYGCDICFCSTRLLNTCKIPQSDCVGNICPKITEITHCSEGGIQGYTTYQLSLIINDYDPSNPKNIYALFGDSEREGGISMIIPPSYQSESGVFNSHLGGISDEMLMFSPTSEYDSWLTIGIINGDLEHRLSSVGFDFNDWSETRGLEITNGAIFLLNPNELIVDHNEYIIAQLTLPSDQEKEVVMNVQGEFILQENSAWAERNIIFHIKPPVHNNAH